MSGFSIYAQLAGYAKTLRFPNVPTLQNKQKDKIGIKTLMNSSFYPVIINVTFSMTELKYTRHTTKYQFNLCTPSVYESFQIQKMFGVLLLLNSKTIRAISILNTSIPTWLWESFLTLTKL